MKSTHPISRRISQERIIAVLCIETAQDALQTVAALVRGGVHAIELTLRTERALEALSAVREAFPDLLLGVGTVLRAKQIDQVVASGADFAVAPGLNADVVRAAREVNLPFAPGIMTPSEIEAALTLDCRVLKFFPAETSGGLKHLQTLSAPYRHLDLSFIPLGGIQTDNLSTWLGSPLISAVGGSWIAPAPLIAAGGWDQIEANAAAAMKIVHETTPENNV